MIEETAHSVAGRLRELVGRLSPEDPYWQEYAARTVQHMDPRTLPRLAALARSEQRDQVTADAVRGWLSEDVRQVLMIVTADLAHDRLAEPDEQRLGHQVNAFLEWHASTDPPDPPSPWGPDDIPF